MIWIKFILFKYVVTNKRVKLPKEITVGTKIANKKPVDINVSVVKSFKLLNVT